MPGAIDVMLVLPETGVGPEHDRAAHFDGKVTRPFPDALQRVRPAGGGVVARVPERLLATVDGPPHAADSAPVLGSIRVRGPVELPRRTT